jgi:transcriptional regulator with XRE-family HTH domain
MQPQRNICTMYIMSTKSLTPEQKRLRDEKKDHREAFGLRLLQLRTTHKEGKKSQQWLADRMGLDRRTVMRLEKGVVPAELYLVAAANRAFKLGIGTLLAGSLIPLEDLDAETDHQLLYDAAYQRVRRTAEVLDRQDAARIKTRQAELDELAALNQEMASLDRDLTELAGRFAAE